MSKNTLSEWRAKLVSALPSVVFLEAKPQRTLIEAKPQRTLYAII
jgi:hypothetical protein